MRTDEGNVILDCRFESIDDPWALERAIDAIPGVVEQGLFLGLADMVVVAGREGVRLQRAEDCRGDSVCDGCGVSATA